MKLLRLILIVWMSIAVPLNGFAAPSVRLCPMQMQETSSPMSAEIAPAMRAAMQECCPDTDTPSSSEKSCKPGQACSLSGVFFESLPLSFKLFPPVPGIALAHDVSPLFGGQIAAIWHPPRLF